MGNSNVERENFSKQANSPPPECGGDRNIQTSGGAYVGESSRPAVISLGAIKLRLSKSQSTLLKLAASIRLQAGVAENPM
jgi:hypothetical protein